MPSERQRVARLVIENAHPYYTNRAWGKHVGIEPEWIERVLSDPYLTEVEPNGENQILGLYSGVGRKWSLAAGHSGQWTPVQCLPGPKQNEPLGDSMKVEKAQPVILDKLDIFYDPETDTLDVGNGRPACYGEDVAENLTAHTTEEGEVVFFVLSNAAKVLLPHIYEAMKAQVTE